MLTAHVVYGAVLYAGLARWDGIRHDRPAV
jgi:hypothetical protein